MTYLANDLESLIYSRLGISPPQVEHFCQRWHITEFALFGSVLRDDFRHDSDIDVLVTFESSFHRSLSDAIAMKEEVTNLFGRKVDFIPKITIEESHNWIRRKNILESAKLIYAKR